MEQQTIAIILQNNADKNKYTDVNDLAADVYALGGSYVVMSWLDRYCLSRNLYRDKNFK
jgi:hypothetical protein